MKLKHMASHRMAWANPSGPRHEAALSCRVRLARNLTGFPFPGHSSQERSREVLDKVLPAAAQAKSLARAAHIRLEDIDSLDRLFLVERRLISTTLAREPRQRAVVVSPRDSLSVMVNEEDHLRLQGLASGLCLPELLSGLRGLDEELARSLSYATHPRWGYLTACATNAGTGLRASVLVHLPALALAGELRAVLAGLARLKITARGIYGEGTLAMGDLFQLSNSVTLGPSEEDIVEHVMEVAERLVAKEMQARRALGSGLQRAKLADLVESTLSALAGAKSMSYAQTLKHLSVARMALTLGVKMKADMETVNALFVLAQPGHVQMLAGRELDAEDRDTLRAALLRRKFS